jgi:tape measure domain-containing protein
VQLAIEVNAPTERAETNLQNLNTKVEKSGNLFGGLPSFVGRAVSSLTNFASQIGFAFFGVQQLVGGMISLGSALLGGNASMEQTQVAFESLLGSSKAAAAEIANLKKFAADTPFEFPDLAESTQKLLAFGFDLKNTEPLLTAIGDALSALGKNSPAYLQQVVDVFGQIHSSGHVMTQDLQQLSSIGINAFKILADQMGITEDQVRDMVTKGLIPSNQAIDMLTKGIENNPLYSGGMAKQSKTFLGVLSTVKDIAGQFLQTLTGPLFDLAEQGLGKLADLMQSKDFADFQKNVGQGIADAFKNAAQAVGPLVGHLGDLFGLFQGATSGMNFGGLVAQFQGLGQTIEKQLLPVAFQLAGWFQKDMLPAIKSVMPTVQGFGNFLVNTLAPAFLRVEGFAAQTGMTIGKTLLPVFQTIEPILVRVGGWLLDMGQKALAFLIPKVEEAFGAVSQFATEMSTRLSPFIQRITEDIQIGADWISKAWTALWPWMSSLLKFAWDDISGIVKIAWDTLTGLFKIGADILSGNWGQLWKDVKGLVTGAFADIKGFFGNLWNDLELMVKNNPVVGFFEKYLTGPIKDAVNAAVGWIENAWQAFLDFLSGKAGKSHSAGGGNNSPTAPYNPGLGPFGGGQRAAGGPVLARMAYTVNERGREMLIMGNQNGYVLDHNRTEQVIRQQPQASQPIHQGDTYNFNGITSPRELQRTLTFLGQRKAALYGG